MAHNHQYGEVIFARGDIGKDEPVFVLRSRDPLAVAAATHYLELRVTAGAPPEMAADLTTAIAEMRDCQAAHGTRPADS